MSLTAITIGIVLGATSPSAPTPCHDALTALEGTPSDTDLYNAAVCTQGHAQISQARAALTLLLAKYPKSALAPDAAYRLAHLELSLAGYRNAAEVLEVVTRRYPKDQRAPDALLELAMLWKGLDQRKRAQQALERYIATYGRKDPEGAQSAAWVSMELAQGDDERLALARAMLRRFGPRLPADRRAVVEATIGRILWDRSCTTPGPDGGCTTTRRPITTACSPDPVPRVRVGRRNARQAAQAQEHFARVLKIAEHRPEIPEYERARRNAYKDAVGMAMVLSHEPMLETLLATEPDRLPRDEAAAARQLAQRVRELTTTAQQLAEHYAKSRASGSPYWVLAAAERVARTHDHVAHRVARSAPARATRDSPVCTTIVDQHRTFEKIATDAYTYCLDRATMFLFFNEPARRCEQWLAEHQPQQYPPTHELFAEPSPWPTPPTAAGVVTDADLAMEIGARLTEPSSPMLDP